MSEKLCLQWNDFKENTIGSLGSLKDDRDFLDVTLVSEDGKEVEAHKIILSISSPFFQNLLKRNKHPHPLIFMRGVKSEDLLAIVDFLYFGETNVSQENLDSFLAIAEELQLKGLMGNVSNEETYETKTELSFQGKKNKVLNNKQSMSTTPSPVIQNHSNDKKGFPNIGEDDRTISLTSYFSGNMQELDDACNSMMEKTLKKKADGHPLYKCKACGKEAISGHLKVHIEAHHLEGISIPCNFCEKTFRSRYAKGKHNQIYHKSI